MEVVEIDEHLENLRLNTKMPLQSSASALLSTAVPIGVPEEEAPPADQDQLAEAEESPHSAEIEDSDLIQFNPPIYLQRYGAVREVLVNLLEEPRHKDLQNGCTILEAGCAEFGLHTFVKGVLQLGKIIYVDIDEKLLKERKHNIRPLPAEYLQKPSRPKPLSIEAYAGDITKVDSRLLMESPRIWAIVAIELIEHLHAPDVRGFEISIFGVFAPPVVVVTTPNSDFNVIFNLPPGKFRHWDHKFEWTRAEFISWCQKVCSEFPAYEYSIRGIGSGPPETAPLGCVSQMAVFIKRETAISSQNNYPGVIQQDAYKLIDSIEYPNYIETRTKEQIILHDLEYTMQHYWLSKRNIENCMENDTTELIYPLKDLMSILRVPEGSGISVDCLRKILVAAEYEIIQDKETKDFSLRIAVPLWDPEPGSLIDSEEEMDEDPAATEIYVNRSTTTDDSDDMWE